MKISPWKVASFLLMIAAGIVDQKVMSGEIREQIAEFLTKNN
jgi:hypothetical protein